MTTNRVQKETFVELYNAGLSYAQLAKELGISERYARVLRDRLKLPLRAAGTVTRDMPADFAEVAAKIGVSRTRKHYKASWKTVYRWASEAGLAGKRHKPHKPRQKKVLEIPEDWDQVAPTLYRYQLATHYGISLLMVKRLIEETGVSSRLTVHDLKKINGAAPRHKIGVGEAKPRGLRNPMRNKPAPGWAVNDNVDIYGLAAKHLRRFYPNVHRADILMYVNKKTTWGFVHGVPNGGRGQYFVAGVGVVTNERLLEMARERGFNVHSFSDGIAA